MGELSLIGQTPPSFFIHPLGEDSLSELYLEILALMKRNRLYFMKVEKEKDRFLNRFLSTKRCLGGRDDSYRCHEIVER